MNQNEPKIKSITSLNVSIPQELNEDGILLLKEDEMLLLYHKYPLSSKYPDPH